MTGSAIALDGHLKSALAIVRSLGERGVVLAVGSERAAGMALHSKYVTRRFVYPSPYADEVGFIDAVIREARALGDKPVIFACSDATYLALHRAQKRVEEWATIMFPSDQAIETAFDKAITQSLARVIGIPTITTYFPATKEELMRAASTITYPAVIKPRKSVMKHNGRCYFGSAQFVHNREELVSVYQALVDSLGESPLIQERLTGEEYGVETIANDGLSFGMVIHHRMRSLSPTGGASVLKETVEKGALRDMLEAYARKIIYELHWTGPIMVEFKVDSDTKTPRLMEVNGRFWGSLPLSLKAGVDMPYHYYQLAQHKNFPSEATPQREGVVTRHFLGDVRHLLTVLFSSSKMRRYAFPKRIEALKMFFSLPPGTTGDVWSLRDPKPAMMEIIDALKKGNNPCGSKSL